MQSDTINYRNGSCEAPWHAAQHGMRTQVTRNESQLTVRQSTAVNPHVIPLVAAKLQILPPQQHRRQEDFALSEDDLQRKRGHIKRYVLDLAMPALSRMLTALTGPGRIMVCSTSSDARAQQLSVGAVASGLAVTAAYVEHNSQQSAFRLICLVRDALCRPLALSCWPSPISEWL